MAANFKQKHLPKSTANPLHALYTYWKINTGKYSLGNDSSDWVFRKGFIKYVNAVNWEMLT